MPRQLLSKMERKQMLANCLIFTIQKFTCDIKGKIKVGEIPAIKEIPSRGTMLCGGGKQECSGIAPL